LLRTQASIAVQSFKEFTSEEVFTQSDSLGRDPKTYSLRAVDFIRREFGPRHPDFGGVLRYLAQAYLLSHEKGKALEAATEALTCCDLVFGAEHAETGKSMVCLADVHFEEGHLELAESFYMKAVRIFQTSSTNTIDHARAISRLAAICRITGRDAEVNKFETTLDDLRKVFAVKFGSLNIGQYKARTASPSARLSRSVELLHWRSIKKIWLIVTSVIDRIGLNPVQISVYLMGVILSTGMALFAFGPFARFLASHSNPGLIKMIVFGVGHFSLVLSLMAGYFNLFEEILGNPKECTSLHYTGRSLAYISYAGCFFLLRDYLHLIPPEATSVVVMIMGIVFLIPSLIGILSPQSALKLLECIGLWLIPRIFVMLPKAMLTFIALNKIGPRAFSLSKSELVGAWLGNKEIAPLNTDIELPEGLLVYERLNSCMDSDSPMAQTSDSKHQSYLWLVVQAGLIAPILMLLPRLCELLPINVHPEGKTVNWYAALIVVIVYIILGNRLGRKSIGVIKILSIMVVITTVATLVIFAAQGKLDWPDLANAFGMNLNACIILLISYGLTKVFIRKMSRLGVPADTTEEIEKPAFSIVFAVIGGLFFPVILLFNRTMLKYFWVEGNAPDWWPVIMFVLSGIAFVIFGIGMARRQLSALKTMSVQIPLLFVTVLGVQVMLGKMSEKLLTGATAAAGVFGLVVIVSFWIARKILHRRLTSEKP
jgi:hypothetical protein